MFDSILDSVLKKVDKIHNIVDVAAREVQNLTKQVVNSSVAIKEAHEAADLVDKKLKEAQIDISTMRVKLAEAEKQIEFARFQALEADAVVETLGSIAGNTAQFADPESKNLMVENDPRLFEQSAGQLNEKDLRKAVGRLSIQRVKLIYSICSDVIQAESDDTESA